MATDLITGDNLIRFVHDGDINQLDTLVRSGVNITYRNKMGMSVLHIATKYGVRDILPHLLEKYPQCVESGKLLDKKDGFNALHHWCANNGNIEVFEMLIDAGFDVGDKTADGRTVKDLAKKIVDTDLQKHIETCLNNINDKSRPLTSLHSCAVDGDALNCISLIENNSRADVMTLASTQSDEIKRKVKIKENLPAYVTPMELAFHCGNTAVLKILTKYTDDSVIKKCLGMSSGKTKDVILRGIKDKLCDIYKLDCDHVVFGTLQEPVKDYKNTKVFTVYSKTKMHGAETRIAGYRVLFRNPTICEKDGVDEGRLVMHHCQKKGYFLTEMDRTQIEAAISQEADNLWDSHSNIRGILSSPVKYSKREFLLEPCIVIVCLFKSFIPDGESMFPRRLRVDNKDIAVDVREGYFLRTGIDNPLGKHIPLKMGCSIGTSDGYWFGTLGPPVEFDGKLCYLVCAHVLFSDDECRRKAAACSHAQTSNGHRNGQARVEEKYPIEDTGIGRQVLQPGNSPDDNSPGNRRMFGKVIMWDYAIDRPVSIDIAVVQVTSSDRIPQRGQFTAYDKSQFANIGFGDREPTYDSGQTGLPTCDFKEANQDVASASAAKGGSEGAKGTDHTAGNDILLFGSSSGPTSGRYRATPSVQLTTKPCGRTKANERYKGIYYIHHSQCGEMECKLPPLAKVGDSGAGVFQRLDDNTLVCIGVLVAVDNTDSALVIPIQPILGHFGLTMAKFQ
ncbi:uncharacterized protein [Argopecten irradians]